MSICANCGKKLNAFTEQYGLSGDTREVLCESCRKNMLALLENRIITEDFVEHYKDEFLSSGITESGLSHIQKYVDTVSKKERRTSEEIEKERKALEERTKSYVYVCPKCKGVFKYSRLGTWNCPDCKIALRSSGFSGVEWKGLSPEEKDNIREAIFAGDTDIQRKEKTEIASNNGVEARPKEQTSSYSINAHNDFTERDNTRNSINTNQKEPQNKTTENSTDRGAAMKKNKVARILKVYSIINAICVIIVCVIIADWYEPVFAIVGAAVGIVVNFLLYACGELLQLLQDIKDNTARSIPSAAEKLPDEDEIPAL